MNASNVENKNLQAKNSIIKNVMRNSETQKVSSDSRFNPLVNAKRNINKPEERQIHSPKLYAATINNTNMTVNDDISDLNGLIFEIQKLKQLVGISHMIMVIRNLNNRLINCKDGMERLQAFIEASELIDRNG